MVGGQWVGGPDEWGWGVRVGLGKCGWVDDTHPDTPPTQPWVLCAASVAPPREAEAQAALRTQTEAGHWASEKEELLWRFAQERAPPAALRVSERRVSSGQCGYVLQGGLAEGVPICLCLF